MIDDPLDYLFGLEHLGIKFGLDNMRALVGALGHPERSFPAVHIAGTNGKGSVTALVDAVLRAAGYRSARYTSPHLIDLTERFVIDGRPVAPDSLRQVVADIRTAILGLQARGELAVHPTFFEATTAAAFELFKRAGVDIAICEVGLGGRLDATNVLTPVVTAIVSIGLDHEQYLGTTVPEIAAEKAGIIKPDVPVVVGDLDAASASVISGIASDRRARVIPASDRVSVEGLGTNAQGQKTFRLRTASNDYGTVTLALAGAHQLGNARVAVAILECLEQAGFRVPREAVADGFATVRWPGRLQHITLDDGRDALLDAAHNPAGARTLAAYLRERDRRPLVFGVMRDKNIDAILAALAPTVSALIMTRATTPRAAAPEWLAAAGRRLVPPLPVYVEESLDDALATAWQLSRSIVVAGSIFLLGDVLKKLDLGATAS